MLKPGGFLQFSIGHPCFDTPHCRKVCGEDGVVYAVEVGGYFQNPDGEIAEWLFEAAPPSEMGGLPKFRTPRFARTMSQWMNMLIDVSFVLEQVGGPYPSSDALCARPALQDAWVVAYFLHIRARKPR